MGVARRGILAAALSLACLLLFAAGAGAAPLPPPLWQTPEDGIAGSSTERLDNPQAIAANPTTGDLYVADGLNARVNQYTPWGEFVRSWGWGVRNGAAEFQTCGPGEEPSSSCQKGVSGTGAGQFGEPGPSGLLTGGIAVDPDTGDVYVGDLFNHRVQKFDQDGDFILMFGGEVDKTTGADVCTAASGNTCGVGIAGEGDGEFSGYPFGSHIAVGSGSPATIYVGDANGRIQHFEPGGAFKGKTTLTGPLAGKTVAGLAVDSSGRFHVIGAGVDDVYRYSLAGAQEGPALPAANPLAVTVDPTGNVYAVVLTDFFKNKPWTWEVLEYSPGGEPIVPEGTGFANAGKKAVPSGLATNTVTAAGDVDVYTAVGSTPETGIAHIDAWGPPPDLWPPPVVPPDIKAQYAVSVDSQGATLKADINPRFWTDTSYFVEYGAGKCSEAGCTDTKPAPPGSELGAGLVGVPVTTKGVNLTGLTPQTTYRYRFVAQSTGSGGEPVHGVGGKVGIDGAEGTFTTLAPLTLPVGPDPCPNASFRFGPSAYLPACRAYEMVSPADKGGGDILPLLNTFSDQVALYQSAAPGNKLAYSTYRAFGDAQSAPYVSQYVASRIAGVEWSSHGVSPPRGPAATSVPFLDTEFRAFSEDLCTGWLFHEVDPLLAPGAIEGYANLYKSNLCGAEQYTALNPLQSPLSAPEAEREKFKPDLQGVSADGEAVVFRVGDRLTPNAASGGEYQVYLHSGGELHLVCILPDGAPLGDGCSAGTKSSAASVNIRSATVHNALAADASKVFWTASAEGPGALYVRLNPDQPQSPVSGGKCTKPTRGCTVAVGKGRFWSASPDGQTAIYQDGSQLLRFELEGVEGSSTPIAGGVIGVAAAGEDASKVYFVSEEALDEGAVAGKPNLYLEEGGAFSFIATLSDFDADPNAKDHIPSVTNVEPHKHSAQATPDGEHLLFASNAPLSGYDNTDVASGEADLEVYLYDAPTKELHCISCNPTRARPRGQRDEFRATWTAALAAPAETQLYAPRVISEDGSKVFFDSYDALVPGDNNTARDVYQWQRAASKAECEEMRSGVFSPRAGGCLGLISSGKSPNASAFIDASADGTDVFFTTQAGLLPQDPGQIDVYDARVNGGLPTPPPPGVSCEGEACQTPPSAPSHSTPASSLFRGPGDERAASSPRRRCAKGRQRVRRRGKARCVKRKASKASARKRRGKR